ncbi:hypothetical protein DM47_2104 [Burkholderia mallei]|nr:hypothetical protein DM75_2932 [Burkholderia mallei]KOT16580.1 hypothetical protein DM47_2104 [Burkholderia mallei]
MGKWLKEYRLGLLWQRLRPSRWLRAAATIHRLVP